MELKKKKKNLNSTLWETIWFVFQWLGKWWKLYKCKRENLSMRKGKRG